MGVWPFRRKSNRRKADIAPSYPEPGSDRRYAERHDGEEMSTDGKRSRKANRASKGGSGEAKKLQRDPRRRTYSFSPGRNDQIRAQPYNAHAEHSSPYNSQGDAIIHAQTWNNAGMAQTSISIGKHDNGGNDWQRVPTLHKRGGQDMSRRKSSKKRKEEHDRETEIKAMTADMPKRPATFDHLSGRPMKKDSKRMRDGLKRNFTNPSSDISLPTPESMRSSMSSGSERHTSYSLKGMFSPHPTIRYAENPRYVPGGSGFAPAVSASHRRTLGAREPITEETMKANKRIDDLADNLTAGDIRELMERDQRRRDRKKISNQKKIDRKLARRLENQRAAEAVAVREGTPPPQNMDRGRLGREMIGLGVVEGMAASIKRRASNASSRRMGKRPASLARDDSESYSDAGLQRNPSLQTDIESQAGEEREEPVIATAQLARLSRASMSPPPSLKGSKGHHRGTSSISQIMDLNKPVPTVPIVPEEHTEERRRSDTRRLSDNSVRQPQSWRSFFKRSSTTKRASIPASFSNISRESHLRNPPSSHTYEIQRSTSNLPKRTMSKFREDLPELPVSPPRSGFNSPDADELPPIHTGFPKASRGSTELESATRRHDTPTSGYRSLEPNFRLRNNETPTSGYQSTSVPSPEPAAITSQSLASIDSEGSWLSGRPRAGSRLSTKNRHPLRQSASSLEKRYNEYAESTEELGIAEDEYFSRLTPSADEMFEKSKTRRASGNPVPSSDEEDDVIHSPSSTKWGAIARHPTVVHHNPRAKSREVLLNDFNAADAVENDNDDDLLQTPTSLADDNESTFDSPSKANASIERATSVSIPKAHARHVSAGSAKLLDVKPRASTDLMRLNTGNNNDQVVE